MPRHRFRFDRENFFTPENGTFLSSPSRRYSNLRAFYLRARWRASNLPSSLTDENAHAEERRERDETLAFSLKIRLLQDESTNQFFRYEAPTQLFRTFLVLFRRWFSTCSFLQTLLSILIMEIGKDGEPLFQCGFFPLNISFIFSRVSESLKRNFQD